MAVLAVIVVHREDVGVFFVEDAGESLGRFFDVGRRERTRSGVVGSSAMPESR